MAIEGVFITPLKIINVQDGDVLHGMKDSDVGYKGFGEAYFSEIFYGAVKAWKKHTRMTLNLVVPVGEIRFVLVDERKNSSDRFEELLLSRENYCRLTIPPGLWFGFQGLATGKSMLLNLADITHDPDEALNKNQDEFNFNWTKDS